MLTDEQCTRPGLRSVFIRSGEFGMRIWAAFAMAVLLVVGFDAPAAAGEPLQDLVGLWHATRSAGPEIHGTLLLLRRGGGMVADVAGYTVPVTPSEAGFGFALPGGKGQFRG